MKRKIMFTLAFFAFVGIGLYLYVYRGHRDIAAEKADYSTTVNELKQQFTSDPEAANKKYADKTIEVYGKITTIDLHGHMLTMDESLSAVFKDSVLPKLALQQTVKIKGRFVGYDDLLEELKMDQVAKSE